MGLEHYAASLALLVVGTLLGCVLSERSARRARAEQRDADREQRVREKEDEVGRRGGERSWLSENA